MQSNSDSQAQDNEDEHQLQGETEVRCSECGKEIRKPLFTRVSSQGLVQTYYACPHCLNKIPETQENVPETSETLGSSEEATSTQPKPEGVNCQHSLGYLKKRPKETAIPEACLTCGKLIECMAK
jgi:DNA-directed RNA polymerase subunit RPC12/RpoP